MLKHLLIRNFAVVEELELQFRSGMTVFTGETGAGKSILVDALGLILGDRADTGIIRAGCERSEISATFVITDISRVIEILHEQAISVDEQEILIRRVINNDGRSRAFVNSTPVPISLLREIGESLVDIHGQHAHQSLMKREAQRTLLDNYGDYREELEKVSSACISWQEVDKQITELSGDSEDHNAKLSLLRYQVQELENLAPEEQEFENLTEEYRRLSNANRLIELSQKAIQVIREDEYSAETMLASTTRDLQEAQQFDDALGSVIELVDSATIHLSEAADELRSYLDKMELDPERLHWLEQRFSDFHQIARKHDIQSEKIYEHMQKLQGQLSELVNNEQRLADLEKKRQEYLETYQQASKSLHRSRVKTAGIVSDRVTRTLESLGMQGGEFIVTVDEQESRNPTVYGNDVIDFLVSANPGQPPQQLGKVASGGELSRISLAIQVISNNEKVIPTLVFDEVDAGIGGGIAEVVGKLLHSLTGKHQVFCVTHLAQVASLADHHLQVQKYSSADNTVTQVAELDDAERIEEIARMLGGIRITEQSRRHAKEMLIN